MPYESSKTRPAAPVLGMAATPKQREKQLEDQITRLKETLEAVPQMLHDGYADGRRGARVEDGPGSDDPLYLLWRAGWNLAAAERERDVAREAWQGMKGELGALARERDEIERRYEGSALQVALQDQRIARLTEVAVLARPYVAGDPNSRLAQAIAALDAHNKKEPNDDHSVHSA